MEQDNAHIIIPIIDKLISDDTSTKDSEKLIEPFTEVIDPILKSHERKTIKSRKCGHINLESKPNGLTEAEIKRDYKEHIIYQVDLKSNTCTSEKKYYIKK